MKPKKSSTLFALLSIVALLSSTPVIASDFEHMAVPPGQPMVQQTPNPGVSAIPIVPISMRGLIPPEAFSFEEQTGSTRSMDSEVNSLTLGNPGLSYRYVDTFGVTEEAYISDTEHINYPWGIAVDGNSVWIAEYLGNRALKFLNSGDFQMQIGRSGYADIYDTVLFGLTDVGTDPSGNIWLVDGDASHIVEFNSIGEKIGELGQFWAGGTENDRFASPQGIAFDASGNIYVSDGASWYDPSGGNHRVQIFDPSGTYLATIGQVGTCGTENDQLCGPRHIAVDGNLLFIADAGNHRVQIFNITDPSAPAYVQTLGISGVGGDDNHHFNQPNGIAVDANYIYVADLWNSRIQVFNRTDYAYVSTIGTGEGTGDNQFRGAADVALDAAGYLYVADFVNTRVQQFQKSGDTWQYVRTYGITGVPYITDGNHLNRPGGVAVSSDGSVYVTEELGQRLIKYNASGNFIWAIGAAGVKGDWETGNDRFNDPRDVAVGPDGNIYVADRWNGRVQIYKPDSTYLATVGSLSCPSGVAVTPNNYLYVADSCQNTVLIYNTLRVQVAVLGEAGVGGTDNNHFNWPLDVAVDQNGNIYIADANNHRIQVYNASWQYLRTMGVTGFPERDFDRFNAPNSLFIDNSNKLYVADTGNVRIQVFDGSGAYLSTIGGGWGRNSGQLRSPGGVAVDASGNVYIADWGNHRVQKFSPGYPDWSQVNINGFGDVYNEGITTFATFNNELYAGTFNYQTGSQIWKMTSAGQWERLNGNGFGKSYNVGIDHLLEFKGNLYAGTWADETNGGEIWRFTGPTNWTRVVSSGFGDPTNSEVFHLTEFNDQLYASTWSYSDTHGTELWRSPSGDQGTWSRVVENGFGDGNNIVILSTVEFKGDIYAGTFNEVSGAELWRSNSGDAGTWAKVNADGFGNGPNTKSIHSLVVFNNALFASTYSQYGGEIWRSDDGENWTQVNDSGFGNPKVQTVAALFVYDNQLIATTDYWEGGMGVWVSPNGENWESLADGGFGDSNNWAGFWGHSFTVFNGHIYLGTNNYGNGGEVWQYTPTSRLYLPLIMK